LDLATLDMTVVPKIEAQLSILMSPEIKDTKGIVAADEHALVAGVLAKDRKATGEFVAHCAGWLYPFVQSRLVPRGEEVDDLMQEIVLAAWQALPTFRGEASLRSWVMGIARHKLEDYYRRKLYVAESPEEEALYEPYTMPELDHQIDSAALREKVQDTLALLPEPYALALIWRYRDEKSVREMAQLTGKTEKAIERLLARARQNFRRRWSDAKA
jgi:RNA polymerase sigma-70 factor (ECF subfamily)